jgi:hypothetical protein
MNELQKKLFKNTPLSMNNLPIEDYDAMTEAQKVDDEMSKDLRLQDPSFGTGEMLMRPNDASEDFMKYLQNPTSKMTPPASVGNPSAIEDFDAMNEQYALDKSLKAPVSAPQNVATSMKSSSSKGGSTPPVTPPSATPQDDILAQLKAARESNAASLAGARQSDKMTELGNLIMKSGAMAGEGIINQSGNTKIKLDAAQSAADESKFAGEGAKSKLEALLQDYGLKKGMDDTKYSRDKDAQARKDRLLERSQDLALKREEMGYKKTKDSEAKKILDNAGQKKLDQEMAKEYQEWSSGGQKTAQSEIGKLKGVLGDLQSGKIKTGGITGMFPDQMTTKGILGARSDVQSSVMGSLRQLLGAQFTEKEGERVIKNTWNEADSSENNVKRLTRLVADLENKAVDKSQKANYFQEKGSTLKGYESDFSKSKSEQPNNSVPKVGSTVSSGGKRYKVINDAGDLEEIK